MNKNYAKELYLLTRRAGFIEKLARVIDTLPDHFDSDKNDELKALTHDYADVEDPVSFDAAIKEARGQAA